MKQLPMWMIVTMVVLAAAMTWVGWIERHEVGPVPLIVGVIWIAFSLASAGGWLAQDPE